MLNGVTNYYLIDFTWDQTKASIKLQKPYSATNYTKADGYPCESCVNNNDKLGMIQIYNAKLKVMDGTFNARWSDGTNWSSIASATYDENSDRLKLDLSQNILDLPAVVEIELTKAA